MKLNLKDFIKVRQLPTANCQLEPEMQSSLHRQRIQTIRNQITLIVEILPGEAGADTDMAGEIIGDAEF